MTCRPFLLVTVLAMVAFSSPCQAQDGSHDSSSGAALDAIRDDLVALQFEEALAAIDAFLAKPGLPERDRSEALVLRAQAHVAGGALDATEEDYRQILNLRPGFVPDANLTPRKAMVRFEKVRARLVGGVLLQVEPSDARLTMDGRETAPGEGGVLHALAGERLLRVERKGYDPIEVPLSVKPGAVVQLNVQLVPNARTVVVRTQQEGVSVNCDGVVVGETVLPSGGGPAELSIEALPLGEHVFDLSKPCYRTLRIRDLLTVDLLDRKAKTLDVVTLDPSRSKLELHGVPVGARVSVDGGQVGAWPLGPLDACSGGHVVEVRSGGRLVWYSRVEVPEEESVEIEIRPRPNAILVGAEAWPPELEGFGASFSLRGVEPLPVEADLSSPEGWDRLALPPETDIALGVLPAQSQGSNPRWLLWSPILRTVERLLGTPTGTAIHSWSRMVFGMRLVDSEIGGPARVVEVLPGSPASVASVAVGDRVLSVGGTQVSGRRAASEALVAARRGGGVEIRLAPLRGEPRVVTVVGMASPLLTWPDATPAAAAWIAAWASVDAAAPPEVAAAALANLALTLSAAGRHATAVETWRRVQWGGRRGIGQGTVAYYLARAYEALGREAEAREAYKKARDSWATAFDDEGPAVGAAAADHLADLGVPVETAGDSPTPR